MADILVVDDDASIREAVEVLLREEGYKVVPATNGQETLSLFRRKKPDLVLLDVIMPGMSGLELCRSLRHEDRSVPIIMLTARGEEEDKVLGFELGADDYIVKPFGSRELLARVRAALRRSLSTSQRPGRGRFGHLEINFDRNEVFADGNQVILTEMEFELLVYLIEHPRTLVTRDDLLREVWGYEIGDELNTRTVDSHIARLRKKLEPDPQNPQYIKTVRGTGYIIEEAIE